MRGTREVVCSTVFTPATPVASGYMRNVAGSTTTLPTRIAAGQYRVVCPDQVELQRQSITARAYEATGVSRLVTVVPTLVAGGTQLDIFIKTDAGVASDDCLNVEVTMARLPL
jgi:hypothetical protein